MSEVDKEAWDGLAPSGESPFQEWDWLRLLEESGSATPATGWRPRHLTVWDGARLVAAAPLYEKSHSEGEFVFDYIWAEVATRLGLAYYPKLVGMTPFTPTGGYRFLIAPDQDEAAMTAVLVREIDRLCLGLGLSGIAFNYADPAWARRLEGHGYAAWRHPSFSWENQGYSTFEDYLALFDSGQRRNIRKERKRLRERGITFRMHEGPDIPDGFFPLMHSLYAEHNDKFGPWGCKYLTEEFFLGLGRSCRHRLLFSAAYRGDDPEPVALAMLAHRGGSLYGRYWGTTAHLPFLHFELCYYAPIEWAISRSMTRYDPGIGGAHKTRRGFMAVPSLSLHRFYDPRLSYVLATYIDEINTLEQDEIDELNRGVPLARHAPGSLPLRPGV